MTTPARRPVPLAGVVLTGGASRRMGRDKATLPMEWSGGRTLVEYVVGVVGQRCAPVFVMAARGQPLPELPAQVLVDEVAGAGPLPAVGRGLRAAATAGAQRAFVCAVDMPLMTAVLIDRLSEPVAADVVLPYDGRDHYLAAVYRTGLARHIEALVAAGERRMGVLIDGVDAARIAVSESSALTNVNSPADLQALAQPKPWLPAPDGDRDEP